MKNIKGLFLCLVILLNSISLLAQGPVKFSSIFTVNNESEYQKLNEVRKIFDSEMIRTGAEVSEMEGIVFLLGLSELKDNGVVAFSITSLYRLPEHIIQAGKYGQVFYSGLQTGGIQKVTEEGNVIRDQMSEDYLRQFYSIGTNRTIITEKKNLRKEIRSYLAKFTF